MHSNKTENCFNGFISLVLSDQQLKPEDIQFILIYNKEKQQMFTFVYFLHICGVYKSK